MGMETTEEVTLWFNMVQCFEIKIFVIAKSSISAGKMADTLCTFSDDNGLSTNFHFVGQGLSCVLVSGSICVSRLLTVSALRSSGGNSQ